MNFIRRIKTRYVLHRYPIQHAAWFAATDRLEILYRLSAVEKAHLRELSTLFLYEKQFIGIGIDLDDEMRVIIAAQACLPILHLGVGLLNPYAATSPAEFFAVMSEYFFTASEVLTVNFPLVFRQLQQYYRQTPLDH
jgi:Mlc titration factor MtfA (ptsG expression regulator)